MGNGTARGPPEGVIDGDHVGRGGRGWLSAGDLVFDEDGAYP
jgi:hypothetical protein